MFSSHVPGSIQEGSLCLAVVKEIVVVSLPAPEIEMCFPILISIAWVGRGLNFCVKEGSEKGTHH